MFGQYNCENKVRNKSAYGDGAHRRGRAEKIIIGIGYGAREHIAELRTFAEKINAGIAATRKMVDSDYLPYELQVGLTGKTVNPDVYIAVGISGAVHHIAGIKQSGTVIAINSDKDAPIFKYADYGIVDNYKADD